MRRRGLTLVELLVAAAITGMIAIALSMAFASGTRAAREFDGPRTRFEDSIQFEEKIRKALRNAYVASEAGDAPSYFVSSTNGGSAVSTGSDTITFTVLGESLSGAAMANEEEDFEARNDSLGPQGGIEEVSISATPVGDAGDRTGIFIRRQMPADLDTEQGGFEQLLGSGIASIGFEFWDGTDWQTEWDSQGVNPQQLPYAIRISYQLNGEDGIRSFVVNLPNGYVEELGEEAT